MKGSEMGRTQDMCRARSLGLGYEVLALCVQLNDVVAVTLKPVNERGGGLHVNG